MKIGKIIVRSRGKGKRLRAVAGKQTPLPANRNKHPTKPSQNTRLTMRSRQYSVGCDQHPGAVTTATSSRMSCGDDLAEIDQITDEESRLLALGNDIPLYLTEKLKRHKAAIRRKTLERTRD